MAGPSVAEQLLAAVESELRVRKCSRISLDTTAPLLSAIRFYEKNGFRRSGKIGDFFGMPLIEYVKDLS
jgi:ribosomal protein S18 acetylase RimI-like enzyme